MGRGVALPQPVLLPSLGRQQSGCPWRRSGHGGRGPHTAPVRARLLSLGAVLVAPLCVSAGSLAHRGSCESRRLGRGGRPCSGLPPGRRGTAGGRGDHLSRHGGVGGRRPRGLRLSGGVGGQGGVAPWLLSSPRWGGRSAAFCPVPLSSPAHPPQAYAFGRGHGAAPGAGCCPLPAGQPGGGVGDGRLVSRSLEGLAGGWGAGGSLRLSPSLCLPWAGNNAGVIGDTRVMGVAAPILLRFAVACRPGAWSMRRSCALVWARPACRHPRGSRQRGVRGRPACRSRCASPRASRSLLREGGHFLCLGGGGGLAPPRPAGREGRGGGEGKGRRRPRPPGLGGCSIALVPVPLGTPPGYTRSAGDARHRGRLVRLGRPPAGQWGREGGEVSLPWSTPAPRLRRVGTEEGRFICALLGAAVPPRPTASAQSRWSAAGNAGLSGRPTGVAWRAAALAAAVASPPWVPRPSRGSAGPPPLRLASGRL